MKLNRIRQFAACLGLVALSIACSEASALADGYYDATWIGGGRIAFQGDEIGDDIYYPPGASSQVDRIFVNPGGDLTLFGRAETDTWIGGMHADGSWILTFGQSKGYGRSRLCWVEGCNVYESATVQPDGGLMIVGNSALDRTSALADGSTGHLATTALGINNTGGYVVPYAVAVQSDGKVLIGGQGFVSQADTTAKFGIARLVSSGFAIDPTFNNADVGGVLYSGGNVISIADNNAVVTDVLLQPDGRIVVVGVTFQGAAAELALARVNTDGTPDATFGSGGTAAFAWPSGSITGIGKAKLDRAGRTVVAVQGKTSAFNTHIMVVARVTAAGILDSSFGQDAGFARFSASVDCPAIYPYAVDVDSAGRILVAGACHTAGLSYFIVIRLRGDTGYLDASFGINGYGLGAYVAGSTFDSAYAVRFDASGHPLVGGYSQTYAGIARLTYDLIHTNDFDPVPRGCLPPDCN